LVNGGQRIHWVDLARVIARLDPKSGLPDFGIKLSKLETSDFDAIQDPQSVVTGSPGQAEVKPGDDRTEAGHAFSRNLPPPA
jgi:hypothetical protein